MVLRPVIEDKSCFSASLKIQLNINVTMSLPGWTITRTVRIAALIAIASLLVACGDLSGSDRSAGRDDIFVSGLFGSGLFGSDLAGEPRASPPTIGALEAVDF